jgi:uncharacterized protein YutE (UPF0331/DUF86 family)
MSAETDYLRGERDHLLETVRLIEDLLAKQERSLYETIALGKLLQDLYTGLERILRTLLEDKGFREEKTESWHKNLLLAAKRHCLVSENEFEAFSKLLVFRHVQVHGYGFMLEDERLVEIGRSVTDVCRDFLSRLR